MSLQFLPFTIVDQLESSLKDREILKTYLTGDFCSLIKNEMVATSSISVGPPPDLLNGNHPIDIVEASKKIHSWLLKLTPLVASDRRLWTFLCHKTYAEYSWKEWGKSIKESADPRSVILDRFFMKGDGIRRLFHNSISSLWWYSYIVFDEKRKDPYELLPVLLSQMDLPTALLERRIGLHRPLVVSVLEKIVRLGSTWSKFGPKGKLLQAVGKDLNLLGGGLFLDCLSIKSLERKVSDIFERQLACF